MPQRLINLCYVHPCFQHLAHTLPPCHLTSRLATHSLTPCHQVHGAMVHITLPQPLLLPPSSPSSPPPYLC